MSKPNSVLSSKAYDIRCHLNPPDDEVGSVSANAEKDEGNEATTAVETKDPPRDRNSGNHVTRVLLSRKECSTTAPADPADNRKPSYTITEVVNPSRCSTATSAGPTASTNHVVRLVHGGVARTVTLTKPHQNIAPKSTIAGPDSKPRQNLSPYSPRNIASRPSPSISPNHPIATVHRSPSSVIRPSLSSVLRSSPNSVLRPAFTSVLKTSLTSVLRPSLVSVLKSPRTSVLRSHLNSVVNAPLSTSPKTPNTGPRNPKTPSPPLTPIPSTIFNNSTIIVTPTIKSIIRSNPGGTVATATASRDPISSTVVKEAPAPISTADGDDYSDDHNEDVFMDCNDDSPTPIPPSPAGPIRSPGSPPSGIPVSKTVSNLTSSNAPSSASCSSTITSSRTDLTSHITPISSVTPSYTLSSSSTIIRSSIIFSSAVTSTTITNSFTNSSSNISSGTSSIITIPSSASATPFTSTATTSITPSAPSTTTTPSTPTTASIIDGEPTIEYVVDIPSIQDRLNTTMILKPPATSTGSARLPAVPPPVFKAKIVPLNPRVVQLYRGSNGKQAVAKTPPPPPAGHTGQVLRSASAVATSSPYNPILANATSPIRINSSQVIKVVSSDTLKVVKTLANGTTSMIVHQRGSGGGVGSSRPLHVQPRVIQPTTSSAKRYSFPASGNSKPPAVGSVAAAASRRSLLLNSKRRTSPSTPTPTSIVLGDVDIGRPVDAINPSVVSSLRRRTRVCGIEDRGGVFDRLRRRRRTSTSPYSESPDYAGSAFDDTSANIASINSSHVPNVSVVEFTQRRILRRPNKIALVHSSNDNTLLSEFIFLICMRI